MFKRSGFLLVCMQSKHLILNTSPYNTLVDQRSRRVGSLPRGGVLIESVHNTYFLEKVKSTTLVRSTLRFY